jgi:L-alanine-DL-glutamate epimerase-like enolase superfamily enzyme
MSARLLSAFFTILVNGTYLFPGFSLPITWNVFLEVEQVADILKAGAADAINIHANQAGGFQQGLRRAHFAWTAGVQSMVGSTLYLGTGTAAYNILSSLLPGTLPCEQLEIEVYGGKSAVRNRFPIRDEKIIIEDRPGIGVDLDMSVIEQRCRKMHELR